jgi:hypothetical protein
MKDFTCEAHGRTVRIYANRSEHTDRSVCQYKPAEDMTTPQLVREFVDNRTAWARGDECNWSQHDRHQSVVTELRSRGVLD